MKAVIVFLIGVAVGWMLLPRLEPEYVVELKPETPEAETTWAGTGPAKISKWHWWLDHEPTWTRTN